MRRRSDAFSLLELLVVLGVMLLMVGRSAAPALNAVNNPRRIAIQELKGVLESARALALKERSDIYVAFTDDTPSSDLNRFRRYAIFRPDPTDPHPDPRQRRVLLAGRWHALENGVVFALGNDFEIPTGAPFGTVLEAPARRPFPSNLETAGGGWELPFFMFGPEGMLRMPSAPLAQFHHVGIIEGSVEGGRRVAHRTHKGRELMGRFPESECLHFDLYSGRPRVFNN